MTDACADKSSFLRTIFKCFFENVKCGSQGRATPQAFHRTTRAFPLSRSQSINYAPLTLPNGARHR
jgi:hypothetical protein